MMQNMISAHSSVLMALHAENAKNPSADASFTEGDHGVTFSIKMESDAKLVHIKIGFVQSMVGEDVNMKAATFTMY